MENILLIQPTNQSISKSTTQPTTDRTSRPVKPSEFVTAVTALETGFTRGPGPCSSLFGGGRDRNRGGPGQGRRVGAPSTTFQRVKKQKWFNDQLSQVKYETDQLYLLWIRFLQQKANFTPIHTDNLHNCQQKTSKIFYFYSQYLILNDKHQFQYHTQLSRKYHCYKVSASNCNFKIKIQ